MAEPAFVRVSCIHPHEQFGSERQDIPGDRRQLDHGIGSQGAGQAGQMELAEAGDDDSPRRCLRHRRDPLKLEGSLSESPEGSLRPRPAIPPCGATPFSSAGQASPQDDELLDCSCVGSAASTGAGKSLEP